MTQYDQLKDEVKSILPHEAKEWPSEIFEHLLYKVNILRIQKSLKLPIMRPLFYGRAYYFILFEEKTQDYAIRNIVVDGLNDGPENLRPGTFEHNWVFAMGSIFIYSSLALLLISGLQQYIGVLLTTGFFFAFLGFMIDERKKVEQLSIIMPEEFIFDSRHTFSHFFKKSLAIDRSIELRNNRLQFLLLEKEDQNSKISIFDYADVLEKKDAPISVEGDEEFIQRSIKSEIAKLTSSSIIDSKTDKIGRDVVEKLIESKINEKFSGTQIQEIKAQIDDSMKALDTIKISDPALLLGIIDRNFNEIQSLQARVNTIEVERGKFLGSINTIFTIIMLISAVTSIVLGYLQISQ